MRLDKIIFGNFTASYRQGLVFESSDYFQPRRTGYKFTKRLNGVHGDNTRSSQYLMDGVAIQFSGIEKYTRISYFQSESPRDAVINEDGTFTTLITMTPRLGNGYSDNDKIYENMVGSVIERTRGANIRFTPTIGTNFGFIYYESEYNRGLDHKLLIP